MNRAPVINRAPVTSQDPSRILATCPARTPRRSRPTQGAPSGGSSNGSCDQLGEQAGQLRAQSVRPPKPSAQLGRGSGSSPRRSDGGPSNVRPGSSLRWLLHGLPSRHLSRRYMSVVDDTAHSIGEVSAARPGGDRGGDAAHQRQLSGAWRSAAWRRTSWRCSPSASSSRCWSPTAAASSGRCGQDPGTFSSPTSCSGAGCGAGAWKGVSATPLPCWASTPQGVGERGDELDPEARLKALKRLATALEARDPYTHGHSRRVARYSTMIARKLGIPAADVAKIRLAATASRRGQARGPARHPQQAPQADG